MSPLVNHAARRCMAYYHHHVFAAISAAEGLAASIQRMNAMTDTEPHLTGACRVPRVWYRSNRIVPSERPAAFLVPWDEPESEGDEVRYRMLLTIEEQSEESDEDELVRRAMEYAPALTDWSERAARIGGIGSMVRPYRVPQWPDVFEADQFLLAAFQALIEIRVPDAHAPTF